MRARMTTLMAGWRKTGYTLDFTVGIDLGYATLGTIGFAGKTEYGAIGTVVHLAARLAEIAQSSQILISQRVQLATEELVESSALGEQAVAGLVRPVPVFLVERLRVAGTSATISGADRLATSGPLTEREREVVGLIVRGCTNREIAEKLVIAEGTAVRHVANILNKLDLHSRAQVAVWAIQQGRPVA
jgi:DNA-binding NarL/FixJ family response regulator